MTSRVQLLARTVDRPPSVWAWWLAGMGAVSVVLLGLGWRIRRTL